ncbi:MAG TPA: endonuclease V, partial [Deltaproteobacteria bacterium]|nr:endonuclease V [Deltaproteobacteria bacterium]
MGVKAAVDVHYDEHGGYRASCVIFRDWGDASPLRVVAAEGSGVRPYRPGFFFERELPCLLDVLGRACSDIETVVVDGYVHLAPGSGKGLGFHLYEALGRGTVVIGVAKSPLAIACDFTTITRGASDRPLYVSCAGCALEDAARWIA